MGEGSFGVPVGEVYSWGSQYSPEIKGVNRASLGAI